MPGMGRGVWTTDHPLLIHISPCCLAHIRHTKKPVNELGFKASFTSLGQVVFYYIRKKPPVAFNSCSFFSFENKRSGDQKP